MVSSTLYDILMGRMWKQGLGKLYYRGRRRVCSSKTRKGTTASDGGDGGGGGGGGGMAAVVRVGWRRWRQWGSGGRSPFQILPPALMESFAQVLTHSSWVLHS